MKTKKKSSKKIKSVLTPIIKNDSDFKYIETLENELYFISMSGDALTVNNSMFFTKDEAQNHYKEIIKQLLDQYQKGRSKDVMNEAAEGILTLSVNPLRVQ